MHKLIIDDQRQTIQGVPIIGRKLYVNIRTVVEAEHLEGWNPTADDIRNLIKAGNDYSAIRDVKKALSHEWWRIASAFWIF